VFPTLGKSSISSKKKHIYCDYFASVHRKLGRVSLKQISKHGGGPVCPQLGNKPEIEPKVMHNVQVFARFGAIG
jgi:hypothetical protein